MNNYTTRQLNEKAAASEVIYPKAYSACHEQAAALVQTQCIAKDHGNLSTGITINFLHLVRVGFDAFTGNNNHNSYSWQATERQIDCGIFPVEDLLEGKAYKRIAFNESAGEEHVYNDNCVMAGNKTFAMSAIKGFVEIAAFPVEQVKEGFRVSVRMVNTTAVNEPGTMLPDEAMSLSFISPNTILKAYDGEFISHQHTGRGWKTAVEQCININMWPVLTGPDNTTLLAKPSPIPINSRFVPVGQ